MSNSEMNGTQKRCIVLVSRMGTEKEGKCWRNDEQDKKIERSVENRTVLCLYPGSALVACRNKQRAGYRIDAIALHSTDEFRDFTLDGARMLSEYVGRYRSSGPLWRNVLTLLCHGDSGGDQAWNVAYENLVKSIGEQAEQKVFWEEYQYALPMILSGASKIPGSTVRELLPETLFKELNKTTKDWNGQILYDAFKEWKKQLTEPERGEST